MNRIKFSLILVITILLSQNLYAQPRSIQYEKDDFFMGVLENPNLPIFEFLWAGNNSRNTELKSYNFYANSNYAREECRRANVNMATAYRKVQTAWRVVLEVEHVDVKRLGVLFGKVSYNRNNIWAQDEERKLRRETSPELIHKLSIVPLKLQLR